MTTDEKRYTVICSVSPVMCLRMGPGALYEAYDKLLVIQEKAVNDYPTVTIISGEYTVWLSAPITYTKLENMLT